MGLFGIDSGEVKIPLLSKYCKAGGNLEATHPGQGQLQQAISGEYSSSLLSEN